MVYMPWKEQCHDSWFFIMFAATAGTQDQLESFYQLCVGSVPGGGHRRTQRAGDGRLQVTLVTHAPTPAEAERAVHAAATNAGGMLQQAEPSIGRRLSAGQQ